MEHPRLTTLAVRTLSRSLILDPRNHPRRDRLIQPMVVRGAIRELGASESAETHSFAAIRSWRGSTRGHHSRGRATIPQRVHRCVGIPTSTSGTCTSRPSSVTMYAASTLSGSSGSHSWSARLSPQLSVTWALQAQPHGLRCVACAWDRWTDALVVTVSSRYFRYADTPHADLSARSCPTAMGRGREPAIGHGRGDPCSGTPRPRG
jgi:hypothetical protein